jgi:hypothetical protein
VVRATASAATGMRHQSQRQNPHAKRPIAYHHPTQGKNKRKKNHELFFVVIFINHFKASI